MAFRQEWFIRSLWNEKIVTRERFVCLPTQNRIHPLVGWFHSQVCCSPRKQRRRRSNPEERSSIPHTEELNLPFIYYRYLCDRDWVLPANSSICTFLDDILWNVLLFISVASRISRSCLLLLFVVAATAIPSCSCCCFSMTTFERSFFFLSLFLVPGRIHSIYFLATVYLLLFSVWAEFFDSNGPRFFASSTVVSFFFGIVDSSFFCCLVY